MRVFAGLAGVLLMLAGLVSCKTDEKMTIDEIRKVLHEGMDRQAAETFFTEHKIPYSFISRKKVDEDTLWFPKWQWKSPNAVGVLGGRIRNGRTRWFIPTSENISITVEIDSRGKVTQVVVNPEYTGT